MATPFTIVEAAGREVKITNPDRVFFSKRGGTKLDLDPSKGTTFDDVRGRRFRHP